MMYCVLHIMTASILYLGRSLDCAADALVPGTCYGRGEDSKEALNSAARIRSAMLKRGYSYKDMKHVPTLRARKTA